MAEWAELAAFDAGFTETNPVISCPGDGTDVPQGHEVDEPIIGNKGQPGRYRIAPDA